MLTKISIALSTLWLGAALFFSAVVAPAAFGVLRQFGVANSGEIAGAIVNRSLRVVNLSGFFLGLLVLLLILFSKSRGLTWILRLVSLVVMVAATAVGQWMIAARMHALRVAMVVPIDRVEPSDPQRLAFDQLHTYSVGLLSTAMLAAIFAIVLMLLRRDTAASEQWQSGTGVPPVVS
ncbi:MAG TPA: DUF4149 domain-containing protein [Pyrinomonadaceae bacterium]|nr:DUF4149 domain-containing protein [Pyrinomonadaceae bacterium]